MYQFLKPLLHPIPLTLLLVAPIGVISNKGLVPLLGVMGAWSLYYAIRDGQLRKVFSGLLPVWVFGFSALGVITAPWVLNSGDAVITALKTAGLSVAGLALLNCTRMTAPITTLPIKGSLVTGFTLATVILTAATLYLNATGEPLWGSAYGGILLNEVERETEEWIAYAKLTTSEAIILLLFWPLCAVLLHSRHRWLTLGYLAWISFLFVRLDSTIVFAAMAGAVLAVAFAALLERWRIRFFVVLGALYFLAMPLMIELMPPPATITDTVSALGFNPNETHRFYIWDFTSDRIFEHPWLGWGMDSARSIDPEHQMVTWGSELMPLHPHNAALQIWLELGLAGAILAFGLTAHVFVSLDRLSPSPTIRLAAIGLIAAYLVYGGLAFGVWQSWWIALAWLLAATQVSVARDG